MKRVRIDKLASVTKRLELGNQALLGETVPARPGTVVACRVLTEKTRYNTLEDVHGRMVLLRPGDTIVGALGHRDALHGYSGRVPESVEVGDVVQLLNLGGVIGEALGGAPDVGDPFQLEVLGSVLAFPNSGERVGFPANVGDGLVALEAGAPPPLPADLPPVIGLVGTSMNSGKTTTACALIGEARRQGLRVAAGKLTGVSLRRDVLEMADCGADPVSLFTDFGVVTTDATTAVGCARALLGHLAEAVPRPDLILLEFGDGLLGTYGVDALLQDDVLCAALTRLVLCAYDPVGAWGGTRQLAERYGLTPDLITGPLTNSPAGLRFCAEELGVPAWNALHPTCDAFELLGPLAADASVAGGSASQAPLLQAPLTEAAP